MSLITAAVTLANNTEENLLDLLVGAAATKNGEALGTYRQQNIACCCISLQAFGANTQVILGGGTDFLTSAALSLANAGFRIEAPVATVPSAPIPLPLGGASDRSSIRPSNIRLICPGGASQKLYVSMFTAD